MQDSQRSSSGFDVSDLTGTLLKELSDVIPMKYDFLFRFTLFSYCFIIDIFYSE